MVTSNKKKTNQFFKFKKGQIKITIRLKPKLIIYFSVLTFFLVYQFDIITHISLDIKTWAFVPLGFGWLLILSSFKTGNIVGYSLSRKAASRAVSYLLVITFFIFYFTFYFLLLENNIHNIF